MIENDRKWKKMKQNERKMKENERKMKENERKWKNANCISSYDEFQVCKWKSEEWMPDMYTTVDGGSQDLQGGERDAKGWPDKHNTFGFWTILVMAKRSCHRRAKAEGPFQFDCDPRSSRRRVKCYLRICDLFFDLLSYMITPALVILPVVVKFVVLRLQSDRWMWRVSTLMHIQCMCSSLCMRDAQVLSALTNVGDSCVLKRVKTSSTISQLIHDILWIWRLSFYMVAELVIWNNDVFNGEFPESPREREAREVPRRNTIVSTMDAVDWTTDWEWGSKIMDVNSSHSWFSQCR